MLKVPDLVLLRLKTTWSEILNDWLGDSWSFKDFTKKHRSLSSSTIDIGSMLSMISLVL